MPECGLIVMQSRSAHLLILQTGHGGAEAAKFVKEHLLPNIVSNAAFVNNPRKVHFREGSELAFQHTDSAKLSPGYP